LFPQHGRHPILISSPPRSPGEPARRAPPQGVALGHPGGRSSEDVEAHFPAMRWLCATLSVLLAAACAPVARSDRQTPEVGGGRTEQTTILLPGPWTATPSPSTTVTPYPPDSTQTPLPTRVEYRSVDEFPDLPSWLKNPETPVIAWGHGEAPGFRTGQLSFINANSGELIDLPVSGIGYFLWMDNMHVAFLGGTSSENVGSTRVLDLQTGGVSIVELAQSMIEEGRLRSGDRAGRPLTWRGEWMDPDQFFFIRVDEQRFYSNDGRYKDCVSGLTGELWICDLTGKASFPLTFPGDGYYDRGTAWSPNASLIAELQEGSPPPEDNQAADRIAIYSAVSRVQVGLVRVQADIRPFLVDPTTGSTFNLLWSPDGERILYREVSGRLCYAPKFGGRKSCLPAGLADDQEIAISYISWSMNGGQVRYISCDDVSKASSIHVYDIVTDELEQIDDDFLGETGRVIVSFVPSPDDSAYFVVDDTRCYDYAAGVAAPRIGIYHIDDGTYTPVQFGWPDWLQYGPPAERSMQWRPAGTSQ